MNTDSTPWAKFRTIACDLNWFNIHWCIATTKWLKKPINEDFIWAIDTKHILRICLCDGHWWDWASEIIHNTFLDSTLRFPNNQTETVTFVKKMEEAEYGRSMEDLI